MFAGGGDMPEASSSVADDEGPLVLHSLSAVHDAIAYMLGTNPMHPLKTTEVLHALSDNVNAMRCTLDPTLSAKDLRDTQSQTNRVAVAAVEAAETATTTATPVLSRLKAITSEIWAEVAGAQQQELELQKRKLQRAQDKERIRAATAKKAAELAAVVTGARSRTPCFPVCVDLPHKCRPTQTSNLSTPHFPSPPPCPSNRHELAVSDLHGGKHPQRAQVPHVRCLSPGWGKAQAQASDCTRTFTSSCRGGKAAAHAETS